MQYLFFEERLDACAGALRVFMRAECRQAEEPFPVLAEPAARRADDVGVLQKIVKEGPAVHAVRALEPDIGRVLAARVPDAKFVQAVCDRLCVLTVVVDILADLALPFLGEHRRRAHLRDIGDAVELGGLAARPKPVQRLSAADERLGHDGIAAAYAREARRLGIGAKLDGALLGALHLVDAARVLAVAHKVLVRRVIEDDRVHLFCIRHPLFQLRDGIRGARRIVGRADIDDIRLDTLIGHGQKAILLGGVRKDDLAPRHDIGVQIDGIDGIGD